MGADDEPVIMCGRDDGAYLIQRELRVFAAAAFIENAAGGHDLDRVVALLVMLTHGFHGVVDAIDDPLRRRRIAGQVGAVTVGVIRVAARGADGLARSVDSGARNDAGIDGIAQRDGLVVVIAEIAYGRESRQKRAAGVHRRTYGAVREIPMEFVEVGGPVELQRQVDMGVDETRHTRLCGQIDRLGTGRGLLARRDLFHQSRLDDDGGLTQQLAAGDIDKVATMQSGRCTAGGCRTGRFRSVANGGRSGQQESADGGGEFVIHLVVLRVKQKWLRQFGCWAHHSDTAQTIRGLPYSAPPAATAGYSHAPHPESHTARSVRAAFVTPGSIAPPLPRSYAGRSSP